MPSNIKVTFICVCFKRIIVYKSPFIANNYYKKDVKVLAKRQSNRVKNDSWGLFIRSMVVTISAITLILIGYFTANYFFGGPVFG